MMTLHHKNIISRVITLLFVVSVNLLICLFSSCHRPHNEHHLSIAFYNCENLFDTVHNEGKEDEDFTAAGSYHYTQKIYEQKLHNIATVIQSMGVAKEKDLPAFIGLAEIENAHVLNDLINQPEIARNNYSYIFKEGPDLRGINTAMLYDTDRFHVLFSESLNVDLSKTERSAKTRDVLHVCGLLVSDTVHLYINHWPSRRGGDSESNYKRLIAAQVNRASINKLRTKYPNVRIIVMGDFNDNPTDSSISKILGAKGNKDSVTSSDLFNPMKEIYLTGAGTEQHEGEWNMLDQIMLSSSFLNKKGDSWHYENVTIYKPAFIVNERNGSPRRSFSGTHFTNGYSDHFPVILYLSK